MRAARLAPGVVAVLLASSPALAQETEGQRLFREGREALERGAIDEACGKFAASHAAEGAVGPLLNLANCEERRGRIASALEAWRRARSLTRPDQTDQRRLAEDRVAALEPRVPTVAVRPAATAPAETKVALDGVEIAADGAPRPVEPGAHELSVGAPHHATATRAIRVGEGERLVLEIAPGAPLPRADEVEAPRTVDAGVDPMLVGGLVAGGVGLTGLGVFAVTGLMALDAQATLDEACGEDHTCPPGDTAGRDAADRGEALVVPNAIGLGVGVVGLGVGAALVVLGLDDSSAAAIVGPRRGGAAFVARF